MQCCDHRPLFDDGIDAYTHLFLPHKELCQNSSIIVVTVVSVGPFISFL